MVRPQFIKTGICSVTLSKLTVEEVVKTAAKAGLDGIEWWGKEHVPHGNCKVAEYVRGLTERAGLEVSSYGSYYRVGVSEEEGLSFQSVLDTAIALGAPSIRVWAGNKNYEETDEDTLNKVILDTMRIAELSYKKGISVTFEYHGGSLTNNNENAIKFANQVVHPNVFFSWQSPHGYSYEYCAEGLKGLLERLNTIHVYHWTMGSYEKNIVDDKLQPVSGEMFRHPLSDGVERWEKYFDIIRQTGRKHFALLEFVKGDSEEQVIEDASVLIGIV